MLDALPISVLLLARDEAARLADLLPRLAFAREIVVVVDTATRDATREVAAGHGARVLEPVLPALSEAAGRPVRALPVPNRLFGGNIAVTGLLAGADVAAVLDGDLWGGVRYLLPDVTLSRGVFLDGSAPGDLPRPVEVIGTGGDALVEALAR